MAVGWILLDRRVRGREKAKGLLRPTGFDLVPRSPLSGRDASEGVAGHR